MDTGYNIGCPDCDPAVQGFDGKNLGSIVQPAGKILTVEWDKCLSGPPVGPIGLLRGGSLCYWAVCRVHMDGANVLFGDGHVKWMDPSDYHSDTIRVDELGNPEPPDPAIVPEATWRKYWDTEYLSTE